MDSHFFYPTVSGSLGEARRLGFKELRVKREQEDVPPLQPSSQPFDGGVRPPPAISIVADNDDWDSQQPNQ